MKTVLLTYTLVDFAFMVLPLMLGAVSIDKARVPDLIDSNLFSVTKTLISKNYYNSYEIVNEVRL